MLAVLLAGKRTSEIADELFLSENTVRTHLKNIYRKLDVRGSHALLASYLGKPAEGAGKENTP